MIRLRSKSTISFMAKLLFVLLYIPSIYAQTVEEKFNQLINMSERPTVEQIRKVMGNDINPAAIHNLNKYLGHIDGTMKQLASSIANLERIYPGAVWRPLGRDAARFGDYVDSFYQNIGQVGRVQRLNASGGSLRGYEKFALGFLESNGWDPKDFKNKPPFVIIDRTGYNADHGQNGRTYFSQSTVYTQTAYGEALRLGIPLKEMVPFFGVVQFGQNLEPNFDRHKFFELVEPKVGEDHYPAPSGIVSTLNSNLEDGTEWHGTFGAFHQDPSGRVVAQPGVQGSAESKRELLLEICAAIYYTAQPKFLEMVQANAAQFGYEFPLKAPLPDANYKLPKIEYSMEKLIARLQKTLAGMKPMEKNEEPAQEAEENNGQPEKAKKLPRYTENGNVLFEWYNNEKGFATASEKLDSMMLVFLKGVTDAYDNKAINSRDFRYLVAVILSETQMTPEFLENFSKHFYPSQASFRKIWTEKKDYFLDKNPKRKGGLAVPTNYEKISANLDMADCIGTYEI